MIGLFGGSFDPIHNGHLEHAKHLYTECNLKKIIFIPCGIPAHKHTLMFSNQQRLNLLQLALKNYNQFEISTYEFNGKISYTIDTLNYFNKRLEAVNFIVGSDSFLDLPHWDNYLEFADLCNLIVLRRGDAIDTNQLEDFYNFKPVSSPNELRHSKAGSIYFSTHNDIKISSTQVRDCIQQKHSYTDLVPSSIINTLNEYI